MKRVAYFFPFSPLPAHSGAAKRCVEVLWGLRELGYRTDCLFVESPGGLPAQQRDEELRRDWGVSSVRSYKPGRLDYRLGSLLAGAGGWLGWCRQMAVPPYNSPLARWWFRRSLHEIAPDVLFMSYAFSDPLLGAGGQGLSRVIDTIDLWSLHRQYSAAAQRGLPPFPIRPADVADSFLDEAFFERLGCAPSRGEFEVYDRYHATLAISGKEASIIRQNTSRTRVSYLPMTQASVELENTSDGPALLVMRAHPFNFQGYFYLVRRVLPLVLAACPSFRLRVIGDGCNYVGASEGVDLAGFMPDLARAYQDSRFAIVPVFGGTGQQVKIVEAMAHGVPVVALRHAAEASPIEHEVNGLVAADARDLAEQIIRLWQAPHLCRQLGQAARETVAKHFCRERLLRGLAEALG